MLPIEKIFGLSRLSAHKDNKFTKAVSRVDLDGLIVGTPFVISQTAVDFYRQNMQEGNTFNLTGLNPCPVNVFCNINYTVSTRDSQLTLSSEPTFLDTHQLLTIKKLEELDPIVNETLNGGSATVFVEDKDLIRAVMYDFVPALCSKYKYYGTMSNTGVNGSCPDTPVLMMQMFHPSHCCAIYYPDQVSGLVFSLSAISLEKAEIQKCLTTLSSLSLFATDHQANILTIDGCTILKANAFNEGSLAYLDHVLLANKEPLKKKKVVTEYTWHDPSNKIGVATPEAGLSRIHLIGLIREIDKNMPKDILKAGKDTIRRRALRSAGIDIDELSVVSKRAIQEACDMLDGMTPKQAKAREAVAGAKLGRKKNLYAAMYASGSTSSNRPIPSKNRPIPSKKQEEDPFEAVTMPDGSQYAFEGFSSGGTIERNYENPDTDDGDVVEVVAELPKQEAFVDCIKELEASANKPKGKMAQPSMRKKKRRR